MKWRFIILPAALAGAFYYVTSGSNGRLGGLFEPFRRTGRFWTAPATAHTAGFSSDENNNIDIYKLANQATVNITSIVYRENWFFQVYPERGQGSGFLIDADGRILTNHHVVSGRATQITVTLADKTQYKARILGVDVNNDLALLKVDSKVKLPFLKLGDSDPLQVGQKVLAIGNPFGLSGTLTTGVVSSVNRSIQDENGRTLEEMVQTDAAINPGNSGGPLLDSHGSVIGINTMIYGPQGNIGIGFAMPVNRAKAMLDEFQARGRIARPQLGVSVVHIRGDLAEALELPAEGGLLIQRVERGSAADDAGLRGPRQVVVVSNYRIGVGGDLIMAIDGKPVENNDSLQRALNRKRAGDMIELTLYRNGRQTQLKVRLGESPQAL
ncbi:MAG: trypsin-like serine protease [Bryobacterales bacterium]|nr:trypsin-like serine protease [Bryobacterales bacterium]